MSIAFIVDQLVLHRGNTHAIMHVYNVILQLLVEQLCGAVKKSKIIFGSSSSQLLKHLFCNTHRKNPVLQSLFNVAPRQLFSCEYCKIFKNYFFYRTPAVAAFEY